MLLRTIRSVASSTRGLSVSSPRDSRSNIRAARVPISANGCRTVVNGGEDSAVVLIVSAPRTSGYVPMDWA